VKRRWEEKEASSSVFAPPTHVILALAQALELDADLTVYGRHRR
jgi:hypothetical protein